MSERVVRCPACGCADELSLIEIHDEYGSTDPGVIRRDARGLLIPPGDFWFSAGDTNRVEIRCFRCDHQWRPRQQLISSETA